MTIVLRQSRKNFETELARDARKYRKRVVAQQRRFDAEREKDRASILRRLAEADRKMYRQNRSES